MTRFRFPIAVLLTSLVLVLALGVAAVLTVRPVLAFAPWFGAAAVGGHAGWSQNLPPELQALGEIPAAERFSHFQGVQVRLADKDGQPITINVTPGTVTAISATSLTINANDGTTKTYTLSDKTLIRSVGQTGQPAVADKVVVVALNTSATATAVFAPGAEGFGPPWARGNVGPGR